MSGEEDCVVCGMKVRQRQEALSCDDCRRWQHRTCNSEIAKADKNRIDTEPEPVCPEEAPNHVSTSDSESDHEQIHVKEFGDFNLEMNNTIPNAIEHLTLTDDHIEPGIEPVQFNLTFKIVQTATRKCKDALVDSAGYSYNVKRNTKTGRDWQCVFRGSGTSSCPASVKERDGSFIFGQREHNHQAAPGSETAKTIKAKTHRHNYQAAPGYETAKTVNAKVKQDAVNNVFMSAGTIVEQAIATHADEVQTHFSRPKVENLIRMANRAREQLRPNEPDSMDFQGFLRKDITTEDGQRHLVFATDQQLEMLADAPTWYIDGTFKVVRHPFVQLYSIHAFLAYEDSLKQVPLLFCLMSRRLTSDYNQVLQTVLKLLPRRATVQTAFADFEAAIWKSLRETIPGIVIRGCNFHWTQAVWRQVQNFGLQTHYCEKGSVHKFVRLLMALPFIPVEHVQPTFQQISQRAQDSNSDVLLRLIRYFENRYVANPKLPIAAWNIFMSAIKTNNDCEGWHRRLNSVARNGSPPFYVLIPELFQEASKLPIQRQVICDGVLSRLQRRRTRAVQAKFFSLWDSFNRGDINTGRLVREVAKVHGPVN
ncbi:hypothetical protein KUTeg_012412 [Tegillarca granosa]|uniref:MULE transposase domain-containing protein n=1 Tax=Tegillarca granosa TaxID=220873 RepID=A0ABQ9F2R9_TEGGR|nr:hypothetical protein KUTeg_012412 [Tegillarca granosa]